MRALPLLLSCCLNVHRAEGGEDGAVVGGGVISQSGSFRLVPHADRVLCTSFIVHSGNSGVRFLSFLLCIEVYSSGLLRLGFWLRDKVRLPADGRKVVVDSTVYAETVDSGYTTRRGRGNLNRGADLSEALLR